MTTTNDVPTRLLVPVLLVAVILLAAACGPRSVRAIETGATSDAPHSSVPHDSVPSAVDRVAGGTWTMAFPTCAQAICETVHTVDFGAAGSATFSTMTDLGALVVGPTVYVDCAEFRLEGARDHITVTPTHAVAVDLVGVGTFTGTVEEAQVATVDGEPTCLDVYGTSLDSTGTGDAPGVWHLWTELDGTVTAEVAHLG